MTRLAKLYSSVLANPRSSIAFRDFERLIAAFGFVLERQRGSHRAWNHPACPRPLIVQPRKDGEAKSYQVAELLDMIEKQRLEMDG